MPKIRIKAPAKINLSLKVGKKRGDGFHPIESIMAAINLFDYIDIEIIDTVLDNFATCPKINIASNSNEIPLDGSNIAYKASELFFLEAVKSGMVDKMPKEIYINIEKNIPVCAGLAGGSTDAAAVIFGLNKIYNEIFSEDKINMLCAKLGSDLNFCIYGGIKLCKGRGEILEDIEFREIPITLIKPVNLKISAKEAYQRFDELEAGASNLPNDLEFALLPYYEELRCLHGLNFQMSGSGPTFFAQKAHLEPGLAEKLKKEYLIIEDLKTIKNGVCCI